MIILSLAGRTMNYFRLLRKTAKRGANLVRRTTKGGLNAVRKVGKATRKGLGLSKKRRSTRRQRK